MGTPERLHEEFAPLYVGDPDRLAFPGSHPTPFARPSAGSGHRPSSICHNVRACHATDNRSAAHGAFHSENAGCPLLDVICGQVQGATTPQSLSIGRSIDRRAPRLPPQKQSRITVRALWESTLSTGPRMVPRRESDELAVSIEYRAITADGRTRHGSFKGVREDLMEQPKQPRRN